MKKSKRRFRPDYAALYPGVEISDEVMAVLKQSDRKMEYMERDLKRDRVVKTPDGKIIRLPEREDSLDRLTDADWEFPDEAPSPEEVILASAEIEELRRCLSLLNEDERELIEAIFYGGVTEREYGARIGLSQKNVNKRKRQILGKIKIFWGS
jgi:RNA polymerase sigma factor (sigma-70 family)